MKFLQQFISKKNSKQSSSKQVTSSSTERESLHELESLQAAVALLETEPPKVSLDNVADNLPQLDDNTLLCILQALTSPVALTSARLTCKRLYVFGGARVLWMHWAREQFRLGRRLDLPRRVLLQDASAEQMRHAVLKSHLLHKNVCSRPSRILRTVNVPLERCQHIHPLHARKWLITEHWDCVRITNIEHPDASCKIEASDILSKNVRYSENEDGSLILVMATTTHGDHQTVDERLHVYRVEFPSATTDTPETSLLLERDIRDWRQGVRASWRLGSGLLLYHPKDEADIFVIEDVLDVESTQRIEIPKSQLEAFAFHQDMLFTVSTCIEPDETSAVLHIFAADDIRKVLQTTPCEPNGKLELPPERWSRKYSALHPIVPRVFTFEFRSNEHTRSGHVVFRASWAGDGAQFYWNVGQVRWSIEKHEDELTIHVESCYELVIVAKDSGTPPTPVKFQKAEERGAIYIDKFKDSLPGCFHVLRPLVRPVDGVEIIEQCFPILLPEDLREKYVKGATICDVYFNEEEGSLLVGTVNEVWAMYYV